MKQTRPRYNIMITSIKLICGVFPISLETRRISDLKAMKQAIEAMRAKLASENKETASSDTTETKFPGIDSDDTTDWDEPGDLSDSSND
jgi:hypothetical protein